MFSSVEVDYLKGLVNSYEKKGYKYYIAHTVTENNNNYDFVVYLSQDKIESHSSSSFYLTDNSIVIYIDSSQRNDNSYSPSIHTRDVLQQYKGLVRVDVAEFIYTNATVLYSLIEEPLNPDILLSSSDSYSSITLSYTTIICVCFCFLYSVIKTFLRIRG